VSVTHLGTTSIVTRHLISRAEEVLVECTIRHVVVGRETLKKAEIPDWVRSGLEPWTALGPAA
jgi:acyl-CoA thioesterase FadM